MFIYLTKFYIDTKVEESSSVASLSSVCDIGHQTQRSGPRRVPPRVVLFVVFISSTNVGVPTRWYLCRAAGTRGRSISASQLQLHEV
jgi:hypothetical protein